MILPLARTVAVAALLLSICPVSGMAQDKGAPAQAEASLSVQGRPTVYNSVVALRGKSFSDTRASL